MSIRVNRKDFVIPRPPPRVLRALTFRVTYGRFEMVFTMKRWLCSERLPLPTVCADACFAPCEDVCAYKQFGDPIAIRALKRAAVDNGADSWLKNKRRSSLTGKKVAIVGAGPAGLTAAYYLATLGHQRHDYGRFP